MSELVREYREACGELESAFLQHASQVGGNIERLEAARARLDAAVGAIGAECARLGRARPDRRSRPRPDRHKQIALQVLPEDHGENDGAAR